MNITAHADDADFGGILKSTLVGRQIVSAKKKTGVVTLDDGTELRIIPNCGAYGSAEGDFDITSIRPVDGVITDAKATVDGPSDGHEGRRTYKIFVYTAGIGKSRLAKISGYGSEFYGTGYHLVVTLGGAK